MKPAEVPNVRPVLHGRINRSGSTIIEASSSVTLVDAGGKRIVVDSGSPGDEDEILESFARMDAEADSVQFVVNTHLHMDHCGCNNLFRNARVVAHKAESPPIGSLMVAGRMELVPGVELVPTPGHSEGSISVFVAAERPWAVVGDAIPTRDNFEKWVPPFIHTDRRLAVMSMELIRSWAEVIVPGHDSPIVVRRKK